MHLISEQMLYLLQTLPLLITIQCRINLLICLLVKQQKLLFLWYYKVTLLTHSQQGHSSAHRGGPNQEKSNCHVRPEVTAYSILHHQLHQTKTY